MRINLAACEPQSQIVQELKMVMSICQEKVQF